MSLIDQGARRPRLAIDAMGADAGVEVMVEGLALAVKDGLRSDIVLHGREGEIRTALASRDISGISVDVRHADDVISMTDKPTSALRRGRGSSMWAAIATVKDQTADAAVSSGNTGALMAMSVFQLRMIDGIDRPAISALWPCKTGSAVVLDVGANVEATAEQLVQFAIMGEAYARALTGKQRPSVSLLNVGSEELKGHTTIKDAAAILRENDPEMDFVGFAEGDDISSGKVDVVATDGFTGNIALKTAEGTAHLIGDWIKNALTSSWQAKMGALVMMPALKQLKADLDPAKLNGAPLLGLNGLVIKSHGGSDAAGVAAAIMRAERLALHPFRDEIARTAKRVARREEENPSTDLNESDTAQAAE